MAAVAVIATGGGAIAVHAQSAGSLHIEPGTELRLSPRTPDASTVKGRVVVLARDTIVLDVRATTSRFALRDLTALEVRGGRDRRRGMLIGAAITAAIAAVGGAMETPDESTGDDMRGTVISGAVIGALLGYRFAPTGWERVPLVVGAAP